MSTPDGWRDVIGDEGGWRARIVVKRKGIRRRSELRWPPLHSALQESGLDWYRITWWVERTVRQVIVDGGKVVRIEFSRVRSG